jgi:hypothetical protein
MKEANTNQRYKCYSCSTSLAKLYANAVFSLNSPLRL